MTRINCISVQELTDKHLLAEYREITRISSALKRSIKANKVNIPDKYKMGEGHVKFFYDKGLYLHKRTAQLYEECLRRGFNIKKKIYSINGHPLNFRNDWIPDSASKRINRDRISKRIMESAKNQ